jgi:thymidine kinase
MSLDLYIGPMFAGKSSSIIGILRRHAFIGRRTICFTSSLDKRYNSEGSIVSHDQVQYPAKALGLLLPELDTDEFCHAHSVVVEEAQFFSDLKEFVLAAVETYGKHVICVGLDGDAERRPFGQLLDLIPFADSVVKFKALCSRCSDGTDAIFTHRTAGPSETQISVGAAEEYEALCRKHYLAAKSSGVGVI